MEGRRSGLFFELIRVLVALQSLLPAGQLLYLLENVPMHFNWKHKHVQHDFDFINSILGPAVTIDATRFGGLTHRARNFWQNFLPVTTLQGQLDSIERPPDIWAASAFAPQLQLQIVTHRRQPPYYPCNIPGQSPHALPTLMASFNSYSFRDRGPGMLLDTHTGLYRQPNINERELLLGYPLNCTAVEGVTWADRHRITGSCIDALSMSVVLQEATSVQEFSHHLSTAFVLHTDAGTSSPLTDEIGLCAITDVATPHLSPAAHEVTDSTNTPPTSHNWDDEHTMRFLTTGSHSPVCSPKGRRRIARRAAMFRMKGTTLLRVMADASTRIGPPPPLTGRTSSPRLTPTRAILASAERNICSFSPSGGQGYTLTLSNTAKTVQYAIFNAGDKQLHPIPANGLFYRWSCDLAGPFVATPRGNTYVMLCIEHFSKHLIVTAIPRPIPRHVRRMHRGGHRQWYRIQGGV